MEQLLKEKLKNLPVDFCEIRLEEKKSTNIVLSGPEIESISEPMNYGGGVRVLYKGGWSYVSFNSLDYLDKSIEKAIYNAKLIGGTARKLKSVKPVVATNKISVEIDPLAVPLEEKKTLLESYNNILLKTKGMTTTKAKYHNRFVKQYYANTEGSLIKNELTFAGILLVGIAVEGNNIQQFFFTNGGYEGYEIVQNLEKDAERTAKTTIDLLKAEPVSGGKYPVVLNPELAGVFTHEAFGHLSESDFLFENPNMREMMKIGRKLGPDNLNIVDDGKMEKAAGFIFYDDEGVAPEKTYLIKNGILNAHLHSRETAEKMGEELTGNARALNYNFQPIVRMTNTYIEPKDKKFEDILSSVDDGLYAVNVLGGQTNLEMFTFSAAYGYEIKKGKLGKMVRDIVLTGNVFDTLHNIKAIGNDLKISGGLGGCGKGGQFPLPVSDGAPHILIDDVVVGGRV